MAVGLYAGSFDPIHRGHLDLIERAVMCLDRLFVIVAGNPDKPSSLLSFGQRRDLIISATQHLPAVVVSEHQGLLVDLAKELHVDVLIRGMGKEQQFELQMAATNTNISGLQTLFFAPSATTAHISSRMIRERIRHGGVDAAADLVPESIVGLLREFAGRAQEASGSWRERVSGVARDGLSPSSADVNTA